MEFVRPARFLAGRLIIILNLAEDREARERIT
jgi:hypothetical protein